MALWRCATNARAGLASASILNICVLGIIFTGMALSFGWVSLVPILESPDENSHFDYLYDVYAARRLIRAREGVPNFSPTIVSLSKALDFERIHFYSNQRVAPDYGSPAAMLALRSGVPGLNRQIFDAAVHPVPSLVRTYPPGYYVLAALGAGLQVGANASPVDVFFAARRFDVILFGIGLAGSWGIFRRLGFPLSGSLIVLATIALFPLSSFVSSSVQPDNLSFAMVTMLIYLALRLRDDARAPLSTWAMFTLLFGILALTKQQYALCTGLGTLPLVISAARRMTGRERILAICLFVAVMAGVAALTRDVMTGNVGPSYFANHNLDGPLREAFGKGAPTGFGYLTTTLNKAAIDYLGYGYGTSATSYWGVFGWLDTPIQFVPAAVGPIFAAIIFWGTIVVCLIMLLVVLRRVVRAFRLTSSKKNVDFVLALGGDPLLLTYIVFFIFMIGLYVSSNNVFGAQGRNWFPFIPAAFACAVFYAPLVLSRRASRRAATALALLFFVTFDFVGGYSAITSIENRFYTLPADAYEPDFRALPELTGRLIVMLDDVNDRSERLTSIPEGSVHRGDYIHLRGWAVDTIAKTSAPAVYGIVDNDQPVGLAAGQSRPDVAHSLAQASYANSGFEGMLSTKALGLGPHRLRVAAEASEGHGYAYASGAIRFRVLP